MVHSTKKLLKIVFFILILNMALGSFARVKANQTKEINQDFSWGVLTINPNKSVYSPDEIAKFSIGVLDDKGKMVCDAKLELRIKNQELGINDLLSTENGEIKTNPECEVYGLTKKPDFEVSYRVEEIGIYNLELIAITKNGKHTIYDNFVVSKKMVFDIEKDIATRIYPVETYPAKITIIPHQEFQGQIIQEIPENFEIPTSSKLIWNVNWEMNKKYELNFEFKAPNISPEFYQLGPLKFINSKGETVFQETRQWQIASDATITTLGSGNWNSTDVGLPWPGGTVPAATDTVIIASGHTVTVSAIATIAGVTINNGGTLTWSAAVALTINGPFVNNGTFTKGSGTVTFGGATAAINAGTGTPDFNIITIASGASLTINTNTTCATFTYAAAAATSTVTISGTNSLTVSGLITMPRPSAGFLVNLFVDAGTLQAGSLTMSATVSTRNDIIRISTGTVTISGTVTHGSTGCQFNFTAAGLLKFGGTFSGATPAALTSSTGTVEYTSNSPVIQAFSGDYYNLKYSGTGATTGSAAGTITIRGDLTSTASPTPGTFNFTSCPVILSGAIATNNIAGFTTTGLVTLSKSAGTATFTGNVNGAGFTLSGAGTLDLGVGFTHIFSGAWIRTTGVLLGNSSTLKIAGTVTNTAGTFTAGSGTVEYNGSGAQTIASVIYNHLTFSNAGAKTMTSVTTVNGNFTVSGTATTTGMVVTSIVGNLVVNGSTSTVTLGATLTVGGNVSVACSGAGGLTTGAFNFTVNGTTTIDGGTLKPSSATGTKTFTGLITLNSGTWDFQNTAVNSTATILGGIDVNGGTFTSGTGLYTLGDGTHTSQNFDGNFTISNPSVANTVTVTVQSGTFTASASLAGTGGMTVANGATLSIGFASAPAITTMTANSGSTVTYTAAAPNCKVITYASLNFTGSGAVTCEITAATNVTTSGTVTWAHAATLAISGTLTIGSGTSMTNNGTVTATTSLTGTGGLTQGSSATLNLNGTVDISTLTATAGTNTVNYTGSGQTIKDTTYVNLTISGTISTGTQNATVGGVFTVGAAGVFTPSSGTMTFNNNASIVNSNTLTFQGITIAASATVSTSASFNIAGTLTVNSSGNFSPSGGTITMTGTGWGITKVGILIFSGLTIDGTASPQPTASFSVANTLTVNSGKNLSPTAGTITMTGGSIANSGTLNFYNLIVSGSTSTTSTFAIVNDLTVNGTLTVSSGTGIITANGNVTGSGTMNLTAGTFQQVVATDKTFGSSSNANAWTFNNLKFNNSSASNARKITPNAGTGDIIIGASGTLTLGDSGTQTITFDNEAANDRFFDINGNFTISTQGIFLASSTKDFKIAGSYSNSGTFTANSSTVTFDATTTDKTIEAGTSSLYKVVFNSGTGSWTIQTNNLTTTNDFTITDVSSLAIAASKTVEVDGTYSVVDAEADDITWNSNSVLYLKSGTPYTVGSKNQAAATYAILQIGANTDIRMWNSTAADFSVAASGSLYSQDHANINGDLYIWGDYHTQTAENPDHDYWSYAIDFDGTNLSGGSERQVDVRIDPSSNVTVDSGDTLAAIGTSSYRTTIDRQGVSDGYGLISAAGTINFEYANFDHLDGNKGLDIQTSSIVTSLNYTTFNNLVGTTAPDDAFMTVASLVIDSGTFPITGISISNSGSGAEFNVNRTGSDYAGYWDFDASTGDFDGEVFDGDDGVNEADPGMLRWDNSNKNPIAPTLLQTEGATNPTNVTDETPEFSAVFNDLDTGDTANAYQIQVDDDINFGSPIWDSTKTALSPTCLQGNRCTDISYAGSALTHGTQYYWKIKFWDIGDLEGAWSTGSNYFIINNAPLSPTVLWTEGQSNPSAIHDTTPEFSAIYNDSDTSDIADFYQIQVDDDPGFGSPIWDSTKTALSPTCNQGNRCADISYSGSALSQGVTYYWQIKYWDDGGLAGAWSTGSNYFTLSQAPTTPTDLLTEGATNPVNVSDTTPEFSAVYNDLDTGDTANAYQIQVDNNQDFGSPIWDSGQQSMTNCNQGSRCQDISYSGSALTEGIQYYWQIKYWDDGGLAGAWSTGSNYFIINSTPLAPDSLLTEGQTNPTGVLDTTPEFSAVYNDPNTGDKANEYQIQVADNQSFTDPIWDSGSQSMADCNQGVRCSDISYAGPTLAESVTYYWKIKFWDDGGLEGAWSTEEAYFQLAISVNQFRFRDIRLKDLRVSPSN